MGELDERQQARLFDNLLTDAEKWNTPPRAQARRAAEMDEAVAHDLSLIVSLREVSPPRSEREFARAHIGQQLADLMRAEPETPLATHAQSARAWLRAMTAPPARAARVTMPVRQSGAWATQPMRAALRRLSTMAAVAMILAFVLLAGASVASAQALPESPLYAVKRAEETTLLALAWNDDSKGQTLAMIANHRITEAMAEAQQRHSAEAHKLLGEFDAALGQLIDLTAHAQVSHEHDANLASAIQSTLDVERHAAAQAASHGEKDFAAAANASVAAANAHIQQAGVVLPGRASQNTKNNKGSGQNSGQGSGQGSGKPQQTPDASPTRTPHTSPNDTGSATPDTAPTTTPASGG